MTQISVRVLVQAAAEITSKYADTPEGPAVAAAFEELMERLADAAKPPTQT